MRSREKNLEEENTPARRTRKPAKPHRARIYGLTRIDHGRSRTHAWHVTITRQRRTFSRYFSDGVCGGKRAALKAALRYRDEVIAQHAPLSRRDYANVKRRNNRSGVPGVCKSAKPRSRFGKRVLEWFWIGYWTPEPGGAYWRKSFSAKKYGEKGAVRLAVAARRQGLAEMEPGAHIIHPAQAQQRGRGKAG